jgi:hypothetical protein
MSFLIAFFSFLWVLLESFACVVAPSFLVSR